MTQKAFALLRIMRSTAVWIAAACFLVGCLDVSAIRNSKTPEQYQPLAYYDWARSVDSDELIAEQRRLDDLIIVAGQVIPVVQLSVLLSVANDVKAADFNRAVSLLDELEFNCDHFDCRSYFLFGELWRSLLLQRREFGTAIAASLKSDEELEALREQVDKLRQQIEALTNIEQQLIEREQPQVQ